ncbi:hypothetical protein L2E82_34573 [Cichorium intybus]|uniref:Uncharacterized protein n=1 Tax=Cichorium intybus TaxID=13427 RepID=A0ACB9BMD1_CICIN|nr:hypothetical protein L2E82_34573 [Cichorium intybus]
MGLTYLSDSSDKPYKVQGNWPENLLMDSYDVLKVSDFGLSQQLEDGTLRTVCGTPNYVAPEVLTVKGYNGAPCDIWSCRVILFVLMAGYSPFDEENLIELYRRMDSLLVLHLSFNHFRGPGFEPLEACKCKALQQLYLAGNQITLLTSLPALSEFGVPVSCTKQVKHLRLEENPILEMPHVEAASISLMGPTNLILHFSNSKFCLKHKDTHADDDEADTIDSIRYQNEVEVELPVSKAIQQFRAGKKGNEDLCDKLDTSTLNAHLKELMPGLTAKVFRTYNASITLDDMLNRDTKGGGNIAENVFVYNQPNKEV